MCVLSLALLFLPLQSTTALVFQTPLRSTAALAFQKRQKCGAAVGKGQSCHEDLFAPTHDESMHCFKYESKCTLYGSAGYYDIDKNPEECHSQSKTFYLWDDQAYFPNQFSAAGHKWLMYSKKWAAAIKRMRTEGYKFTSPAVHMQQNNGRMVTTNLNAFYEGCGKPCSDEDDAAYIDINAITCACGFWSRGDCKATAESCTRGAEAATQKRDIYVTNWWYFGDTDTSVEKNALAMNATSVFFTAKSVQRVYWNGVRETVDGVDHDENSLKNKLSKKETLGQIWANVCSKL